MTVPRALRLLALLVAAAALWRGSLVLTRRGATGTLVAREPEFTLRLRSATGQRTVEGRGGRAVLRAGPYLLEDWSARMRDDRGRLWEVRRSPDAPSRMLRVPTGGSAPLPLAAPIQPELVVEQSGPDTLFRLRLQAAGGEPCGEVRVDGRRVPPPVLRIEDARGRVVARLRTDDTCGAVCVQSWRAPRALPQPLLVTPEPHLGPFAAPPTAFRFRLPGR